MIKKPHQERRQFGRRETLLHAIALIPGRGSVHCVVNNLSEQGAHLTFTEPLSLPPVIRVRIEATGAEHKCSIRYSGAQGVGVLFVDQATAERIATTAEEAARRRPLKHRTSPAVSGVRLREELQAARDANAPPDDMRTLPHVPGRVIRGI